MLCLGYYSGVARVGERGRAGVTETCWPESWLDIKHFECGLRCARQLNGEALQKPVERN